MTWAEKQRDSETQTTPEHSAEMGPTCITGELLKLVTTMHSAGVHCPSP